MGEGREGEGQQVGKGGTVMCRYGGRRRGREGWQGHRRVRQCIDTILCSAVHHCPVMGKVSSTKPVENMPFAMPKSTKFKSLLLLPCHALSQDRDREGETEITGEGQRSRRHWDEDEGMRESTPPLSLSQPGSRWSCPLPNKRHKVRL